MRTVITVFCLILLGCFTGCQRQAPEPGSNAGESGVGAEVSGAGSALSIDQRSYRLGGIGAFSEMVGAGVKNLALSAAMPAGEIDALVDEAREIAARNGAEIYREADFLVTDLFAAEVTDGLEVLIIYKGQALQKYMDLKERKRLLVESGSYDGKARTDIAREMGTLLSYPEEKITSLLTSQQGEGR